MITTIGVVHPGEMGSAVGAEARTHGARVIWASDGRSAATAARARADGLENVRTLDRLVAQADLILSVCPPASAHDVAVEVRARGFRGIYVDANAVAPETTRDIGDLLDPVGATFVDGGIIGPPPRRPGLARLYLSGAAAREVADVFAGSLLKPIVLDGGVGAASALKMAYGGWNKGMQALLLAVRAFAEREGVDDALLAEWARSMPDVPAGCESALARVGKAWRFAGEMEETATAFDRVGLPAGFHHAAAEIYRRLAGWKDTPAPPSVAEVAKALSPG